MGEAIITRRGGGGSNIKSIQRGTTALSSGTTVTQAITPVDLTKAIVKITSVVTTTVDSNAQHLLVQASFANAATLSFSRYTASTTVISIAWEVVEFNNVKSLQTITKTIYTVEDTQAITAVDPLKTALFVSHKSTEATSGIIRAMLRVDLTNATTLRFLPQYQTSSWQYPVVFVVEFN